MSDNQGMDLASLLGAGLDDIADLPTFQVPENGNYHLLTYFEVKEVNKKACIEQNFEVKECLEQVDPQLPPTPVGTKFSVLYQLDNEFGLGSLKAAAKPFFETFGYTNFADLISQVGKASGGVVISATIKRRVDKDDKEKIYARLSNMEIAS